MESLCSCISEGKSCLNESVVEQCGCELGCGYNRKRFPIRFLNYFATSKFALLFLCIASIGQGFLTSGLLSVVISTLEKRFHLHSTETGFIASSYDIAACLSVLLITYLGGKGHKPLWIGWGVFIMGIGSFVFTLPHFVAPTYVYGEEGHNICNSAIIHGKCLPSNLKAYMFFFVVGQLLHGMGGTTLFTLGVTYLDENVSQVQSSLYHGVYYASSVVGPALGYLFGGSLLTIYTDIYTRADISESSPLWVGAWWIGFFVGGIMVIFCSFPILLLPKRLPGTDHLRVGRETEMHQNKAAEVARYPSTKSKFRDAWDSVVALLRNPTFVLLTLAGTLDMGLIFGLTTFGPKYLESMYGVSPSQAATYFGGLAISAGVAGQLLGGVIVAKAKLTVKGIIKLCLACSVFTVLTTFIFFSTCPDLVFAGATVPYANESESSLSAYVHITSCNQMCDCNTDTYEPVCGEDGITYYSPCLAGCRNVSDDFQKYFNCSCIPSSGSVVAGKCESNSCKSLPVFLTIFFFSILGTFLPMTPGVQAVLRVVPFSQRSFAIGVKSVILRLLGSIPAPIIIGKVLDLACAVWSSECGNPGSCELYMNQQLASALAVYIAVVKISIVFLFIASLCAYNPPPPDGAQPQETEILTHTMPTVHSGGGAFSGLVRRSDRIGANVAYSALKEEVEMEDF